MSNIALQSCASVEGRLRTLYTLLAAVCRAAGAEEIYQAALAGLLEATMARGAAVLLFDDAGSIVFKAARGLSVEYQTEAVEHSPWERGARGAQPSVVSDVSLDERCSTRRERLLREGIRAFTSVPLAANSGVLGELVLYYAEPRESTADELEIAAAIAASVALAIENKRAEQLVDAGLHLAAIVESSEDAIVGKNLNGIITSWNQGAERIFGYTAAEAIGQPVSILAAPDRLDEMPEILSKIRRGERAEHYDTRRRKKDGQIIDVALSVSPVRNSAGQIVGASKIARDITERVRADQERTVLLSREQDARQTAELLNHVALRLSAQLDLAKLLHETTEIAATLVGAELSSFFRHAGKGPDDSYVLYALAGVPREEFQGFPAPRHVDLFGPTFRGEGVLRCDDVTLDPRYGQSPPHLGMPKQDFAVRSYLAVPVKARSGEVLGGLFFGHSAPGKFSEAHEAIIAGIAAQTAIAMDNARLFEQAQWVQTELTRSIEELRRANQDLEAFAYSASHDLQEPLRTLSISAEIIQRNWGHQLDAGAAGFLGNILTAANRMSVLLKDLLAYTKATKYEEGPLPEVDSQSVVANVLEDLRGSIEDAEGQPSASRNCRRLRSMRSGWRKCFKT